MTEPWDGLTERRASYRLAESLRHETIQVNSAVMIVGFCAVIMLNIAALVGHGFLSSHGKEHARRSERFREQISCFVVGSAQGKTGTDLLTACKFIQIGGID